MASKVQESDTNCFFHVIRSKWSDAALITGGVALGVLGGLASLGIFSFLSHTQAAYLSYGLYGGCATLLLTECVKRVIQCMTTSKQKVADTDEQSIPPLFSDREVLYLRRSATNFAYYVIPQELNENGSFEQHLMMIIDSSAFRTNPIDYLKGVIGKTPDIPYIHQFFDTFTDSGTFLVPVETEKPFSEEQFVQLAERFDSATVSEFFNLDFDNRESAKKLIKSLIYSPDFQKDPALYIEKMRQALDKKVPVLDEMRSLLGSEARTTNFDMVFWVSYLWLIRNYPEL